ncbi:MAG: TIGR01459 family HAD-type hydrolase [Alphaproteobacteria bacterium]|nr:TIGR01459 family HAD-type hydrolase [Alphaproteobacteria bacterium]
MEFIKGFAPLLNRYDGFIIDLYGVVHNGQVVFEGVIPLLEALRDQNKMVIFLSNSPRRGYAVADSLQSKFKITEELYDDIYTSGEDAYINLMHPHHSAYKAFTKKCIAITELHHKVLFDDLNLEIVSSPDEATFIMNTGPSGLLEEEYRALFQKTLAHKLPMLCVNPDLSVLVGERLSLCAGSIAQIYEEMQGMVYYHGKPHPAIYEAIFSKFGAIPRERLLAIGDSLSTDILGANRTGIDSALVFSGIEGRTLDVKGSNFPQPERLEALCAKKGAMPTYGASSLAL